MDNNTHHDIDLSGLFSRLLNRHGVKPHQQTALLTQICGLSTSQARRKLLGASWSFDEVLAITRYLGVSLDDLLTESGAISEPRGKTTPRDNLAACLHLGNARLPCTVRLGRKTAASDAMGKLIALQHDNQWQVGEGSQLRALFGDDPGLFEIDELLVQKLPDERTHIAFLDDDPETIATLTEWFNEAGYQASGFTQPAKLMAGNLEAFDGFVIDFLLSGGRSAVKNIETLRQRFPEKPIVLLTGKLQDGSVSEAELIPLLRTMNVLLFEKPIRPSVLAATLQNALDATRDPA